MLAIAGGAMLVMGLTLHILRRISIDPAWAPGAAEVLFLGTSHTAAAIDGGQFTRPTGCLAIGNLDLLLAERALERHLSLWPKLDILVVEVCERSLLNDTVRTAGAYLPHLIGDIDLSVWELPTHSADPATMERLAREKWVAFVSGKGTPALFFGRRLTLANLVRRLYDSDTVLPLPPGEATPARRWFEGPAREARIADLAETSSRRFEQMKTVLSSPAENIEALGRLAAEMQRRGIRLVLLSLPSHESYSRLRPAEWDQTVEEAVALARARSEGAEILYWNLRADPSFGDEDFHDGDHLGPTGRVKLCRLLDQRLQSMSEAR